jgi:hypothetical protein
MDRCFHIDTSTGAKALIEVLQESPRLIKPFSAAADRLHAAKVSFVPDIFRMKRPPISFSIL